MRYEPLKIIMGHAMAGAMTVAMLLATSCGLSSGIGPEKPQRLASSLSEQDIALDEENATRMIYGEDANIDSGARARMGQKQKTAKLESSRSGAQTKLRKKLKQKQQIDSGDTELEQMEALAPESQVHLDKSRNEIEEAAVVEESGLHDLPRRYQPVNYPYGPLRVNPSLWPDESQSSSLFRDFRAFQPMDIVTIVINEVSEGKKKADTDTKSEASVLAGIAKFFGIETSKWESNNAGIDPSKLIEASTKTSFKGEGETNRSGKMTAQVSARIVEVLPNGLLRVEGRKNLALNNEEEVIVVKGLVRPSDVSALNQVPSNRIADLEIAFYGKGVLGDEQSPGWLYHWFRKLWPF